MDDATRRLRHTDGFDDQSLEVDEPMDGGDATSRRNAEIRTEIEQTRADLAETVEAIEQKLRPSAVVARAAESVKEAASARVHALTDAAGDTLRTAGTAAQRALVRTREGAGGIMGMMRDNPVPAALIAVGAGWLLANARRDRRRESTEPDMDAETARHMQTDRYWREMKTHDRPGMELSAVRRGGQQARAQFNRMTSENPLLVGAGALLIGAAFGLALPETEGENSLMGDARDSLVDRAQQMAGNAAELLKERASAVVDLAGDMHESPAPRSQG